VRAELVDLARRLGSRRAPAPDRSRSGGTADGRSARDDPSAPDDPSWADAALHTWSDAEDDVRADLSGDVSSADLSNHIQHRPRSESWSDPPTDLSVEPGSTPPLRPDSEPRAIRAGRHPEAGPLASLVDRPAAAVAETLPSSPSRGVDAPQVPSEPALDPLRLTRESGRTEWGGLMLLLNVLEPAGVLGPGGLPSLGRTLRWCLHRLALALAPVGADDPAALAFAGLSPAAPPPSLDAPPPSAAEDELTTVLRGRVAARLRRALDAGDESPDAVLARICHRPALIVADPGWIEVHYPLAVVSTEVRRAGLDLDPDWLPWLGVVVKLRYQDRWRDDWLWEAAP
jgi:hypothetical protein